MSSIQIQWVLDIFGQITAKITFSVWQTQGLFIVIGETEYIIYLFFNLPRVKLLRHQRKWYIGWATASLTLKKKLLTRPDK